MHPDSPRAVLPAHWHWHEHAVEVEAVRLRHLLEEQAAAHEGNVDVELLTEVLRSTVDDSPVEDDELRT